MGNDQTKCRWPNCGCGMWPSAPDPCPPERTLSPETQRALQEIDDNQREAWRRAPTTFFD